MNAIRTFFHEHIKAICVVFTASVLFSAIFCAYSAVFPAYAASRIAALDQCAPLSAPDAVISCDDGSSLIVSDAAKTAFSALGTYYLCIVSDVFVTETDHADTSAKYRICALPKEMLTRVCILTDGRIPEENTECILLPLQSIHAVSVDDTVTVSTAASAISASEISEVNPIPSYTLHVTGIGANSISILSPLTDTEIDGILLVDEKTILPQTLNSQTILCLFSETKNENALTDAISSIYKNTYSAQLAAAADALSAQDQQRKEAFHTAETQCSEQAVAVQSAYNQWKTAALRAEEAEHALLSAMDTLESERQQFYSDMEIYEYYTSDQLPLILRRDAAEERFAKQETEIADLREALAHAQTALGTAEANLNAEKEQLAILTKAKEAAEEAQNRAAAEAPTEQHVPAWHVTKRTEETGYDAAMQLVRTEQHAVLPYLLSGICCMVLFAALLFFVQSPLAPASPRSASRKISISIGICFFLSAVLGIYLGAGVFPMLRFDRIITVPSVLSSLLP